MISAELFSYFVRIKKISNQNVYKYFRKPTLMIVTNLTAPYFWILKITSRVLTRYRKCFILKDLKNKFKPIGTEFSSFMPKKLKAKFIFNKESIYRWMSIACTSWETLWILNTGRVCKYWASYGAFVSLFNLVLKISYLNFTFEFLLLWILLTSNLINVRFFNLLKVKHDEESTEEKEKWTINSVVKIVDSHYVQKLIGSIFRIVKLVFWE